MLLSSVSAAERVCDCDEGAQCPNESNPIFFIQTIYGHPARFAIVDMARWWKAFYYRIESALAEAPVPARTTRLSAWKAPILLAFSRSFGEELRIPPSPPFQLKQFER
jgi:hypothetical protein